MCSIDNNPLLQALCLAQAGLYVDVASLAAAVYDNLHTLPIEIQYIWAPRLTFATILYYISRYGLYVEFIIKTYSRFTPSMTPGGCSSTSWTIGYIFSICLWAGEALLGLRVLALSGSDRRLIYSLPIIFIALWITNLVTLGSFFNSMKYGPSPAPTIIRCFVTHTNIDIIKSIICIVVWDILMFILLMRVAYYGYKSGSSSQLVAMICRDGMIYYIYTIILHVGNLVTFFAAPPVVSAILTSPTRLLSVAFVCRVLLYTRKQEARAIIEMNGPLDEETRSSTSHSLSV